MTTRMSGLGALTARIVEDLGAAIVGGDFSNGTPFPFESELCVRYNASRTVVREAAKVLSGKGLISSRQRSGAFVRPEREWNILDPDVLGWMLARNVSLPLLIHFTRARLAIEPAAAAEAARAGTETQITAIGVALARMAAADEGRDQPLEADIAFHLSVIEASNNPFFIHMRPMVETALRVAIQLTNRQQQIRVGRFGDHQRIYHAIRDRDQDRARGATVFLLEEALDSMLIVQREQASVG